MCCSDVADEDFYFWGEDERTELRKMCIRIQKNQRVELLAVSCSQCLLQHGWGGVEATAW